MPTGLRLLLLCSLAFGMSELGLAASHHWANSSKESVGTAFGSQSSKVWFTVNRGILTETYYPRIDRAQVGDSQLLFVTGGKFLEEKRDFETDILHPPGIPRALIRSKTNDGSVSFAKEILTDSDRAVVRLRYRFRTLPADTKIFLLHKPTVDNDGANDVARTVSRGPGTAAFIAWDANSKSRDKIYQSVLTSVPVKKSSIGIVGETDGWQDISRNGRMVNEIQNNGPGNLAFTAELATSNTIEILIGFGTSAEESLQSASSSLNTPFEQVAEQFDGGWKKYTDHLAQAPWLQELPESVQHDLIWDAVVVKAHEDKLHPGAIVAGLSIPNLPAGTGADDGKDTGGYHLVWPRDLFKSGLSLLRLGDKHTALNVLRFMAQMEHDGKMAQNAWVDGTPFWKGEQFDEEAFPILLGYELKSAGVELDEALRQFLDRRIARIQMSGGRTGQERWEEAGGFSPNTIAVMSAALSRVGDNEGSKRLLNIAMRTTVSRRGPLSSNPYFLRVSTEGNPDAGAYLQIANDGPRIQEYRILDGGFLEWLRWFPNPEKYFGDLGSELRTTISNTLTLYDDPKFGVIVSTTRPLFRRYNNDAYGVNHEGGPWPILTLERALGDSNNSADQLLKYMRFVRALYGPGEMCPEQLDRNGKPMPYAASPLVWCHAEMIESGYRAARAKRIQ